MVFYKACRMVGCSVWNHLILPTSWLSVRFWTNRVVTPFTFETRLSNVWRPIGPSIQTYRMLCIECLAMPSGLSVQF